MNNKNFEKVSKRSTSKDIFIDNENYFNSLSPDKLRASSRGNTKRTSVIRIDWA